MQAPFDIAADLDTPVSAYRKLHAFDARFLLESVEGGERLARYSFIGLGDAVRVRLDAHGLTVRVNPAHGGPAEETTVPPEREAVMAGLRRALALAPQLKPLVPNLPLDGGLVGLIGYDFVRLIERLGTSRTPHGPACSPATVAPKPLVATPPPSAANTTREPDALLVAPRSMLVFDHVSRRIALLHAGEEWERQALRREIIAALRGPQPAPPIRSGHEPASASLSRSDFVSRVAQVQEHIRAGDVFQLVLSVRFCGRCLTEPFEVYRALRLLNPSPYMYFCDFGELQIVGSSPEALVRCADGVASLRPIAGTRPRGSDPATDARQERDLLADPKEAAEHVMLVDLARNDLGRVATPGSIRVEPFRTIERYSHVMHIVSGVTGQLEPGRDAFDLFAATFPAGTVVGAPKVRAMQIIDQLEPVRRGAYAGTVGYFAKSGAMDQAIAIRTLVFRNGTYAYQAGAGVVADSQPHAEYDEVRAKVGALEAALTLAQEGL